MHFRLAMTSQDDLLFASLMWHTFTRLLINIDSPNENSFESLYPF